MSEPVTIPRPKKALALVPFAQLRAPDLTSRYLIKGAIESDTVVLIFGESGCGKTFLVLDMVLHIAMGAEWFGRRVRQGRVIYVAAEAGRSIRKRVEAFAIRKFGDETPDPEFLALLSPVDLCHLDRKGNDVARLIEAIKDAGGARVVVIDTVSRALAGGDENAPDDMGAFVQAMDRLRDEVRCTVIAVHHVGKDASRGGRGHSLLHCAVDTEIEVERRDGDVCAATVTKQRDGPSGVAIGFKLAQVDLGEDQDKEPVTSCVVEPLDYVPEKKKSNGLTGQAKDALAQLNKAFTEKGELRAAGAIEHHVVKIEVWHEYMEKSKQFGKDGAFRTACTRTRQRLEKDGHIGVDGEFVWPTKPDVPPGGF